MEIRRIWFHELPAKLPGSVVVVDVDASSSNMSILLSKYPKKLIVVNETKEVLERARQIYSDSILIGESDWLPPSEFVFNNELINMYKGEVTGKNILWMSVNGSRVFEETMNHAEVGEVLAGALNNCKALADYLREKDGLIYIIMAGNRGVEVSEDRIGGEVIEKRLRSETINWEEVKKDITFVMRKSYPDRGDINLPFLVDRIDEFDIIPKCFKNKEGFLEMKPVS